MYSLIFPLSMEYIRVLRVKIRKIRHKAIRECMREYFAYIMVITCSKGKDQPGKAANPARGELNREIEFQGFSRGFPRGIFTAVKLR